MEERELGFILDALDSYKEKFYISGRLPLYYRLVFKQAEEDLTKLNEILSIIKGTFTFRNALRQVINEDSKVFPQRHKQLKEWLDE